MTQPRTSIDKPSPPATDGNIDHQEAGRLAEVVVRHSPIGMMVLDNNLSILAANPKAYEIFDLDMPRIRTAAETDQPTSFLETLPDEEVPRWRSLLTTVLISSEEFTESRFYHHTKFLEKVLSLRICPLPELPGEVTGLCLTFEDVTDKVTLEQYVILSEKLVARGEMAASVAHQLNNHLAIIANNAELMTLNVDRRRYEKAKFNSKSIIDNVFKIKLFAEGLLDHARPQAEYINYDIKHLIDDLLFSLRVQSRFKLIHFTVDMADEIPNVEMDVGQIQQVLLNMLNNAADAIDQKAIKLYGGPSPYKREIEVVAQFDKSLDMLIVDITDNGMGIPKETMPKVFTLHFTTKRGGHGLGLYNCKMIAEQHGGTLTASSVENEGSTFSLTLPRQQRSKVQMKS